MVAHVAGRQLYGWVPAPSDDRRDSRLVGVAPGPCRGACRHRRCRWRRAAVLVAEIDRQRNLKHSPPAAAAVPVGGEPNRSGCEVAGGSCSTPPDGPRSVGLTGSPAGPAWAPLDPSAS